MPKTLGLPTFSLSLLHDTVKGADADHTEALHSSGKCLALLSCPAMTISLAAGAHTFLTASDPI